MRPKRGLQRRGAGSIKGRPIESPGAVSHVRGRLPRFTVASGIRGPAGSQLATTTARVVAYLLDTLLLAAIGYTIWSAMGAIAGEGRPRPLGELSWTLNLAIEALYFVGLWTSGGQTVGMWLLGIRIVHIEDGGRVTILAACLRWLVLALPVVVASLAFRLLPDAGMLGGLLGVFAGWVWPLILLASVVRDPSMQGIHDRVGRTAVAVARH